LKTELTNEKPDYVIKADSYRNLFTRAFILKGHIRTLNEEKNIVHFRSEHNNLMLLSEVINVKPTAH